MPMIEQRTERLQEEDRMLCIDKLSLVTQECDKVIEDPEYIKNKNPYFIWGGGICEIS